MEKPMFFIDYFHILDSTRQFYTHRDTVVLSNGYRAFGVAILDPYMSFSGRKIGSWTCLYPNGKIFSQGNYGLGVYTICQAGGPNDVGYDFKIGQWSYWHDNGQLMTTGVFQQEKYPINTSCEIDTMYISKAGSTWTYYDSLGKPALNTESMRAKIDSSF